MPLLRRRKSSFIHGAEDDARELSAELLSRLNSNPESQTDKGAADGPVRPVHVAA